MKKINKKVLFIIVFATVVSVVFMVAILLDQKQADQEKEGYLIPRENVTEEEWRRQLKFEDEVQKTVVKNIYDGYQIEMPDNWIYDDVADPIGGFTAYKLKEGETAEFFPGFDKAILLVVQTVDNPEKMSVVDWLSRSGQASNYLLDGLTFEKVEHPNETRVYSSQHPLFALEVGETHEHSHTASAPRDPTDDFVPNSAKIDYVFASNDKVYIVSCGILGTGYTELLNECKTIIQTFKVLN